MARRALVLIVLMALATLGGCGGDDESGNGSGTSAPPTSTEPTTTPSTAPTTTASTVPSATGLRAGIETSRLFANRRNLALDLHVEGATGVPITAVRLASPLFEPDAGLPREVTIQAGQPPVSMPLSYGAAVCGATAEGPSTVEVTVNGVVEPLPLDQASLEVLREVHDDECAVRRVTEVVELRLGDEWEPAGENAIGGQVVLRALKPGVEAELGDLGASIVYTIHPDGEPPLAVVDGDTTEVTVDVRIVASRCDAHALTESARKYIFTAYITLDGASPQPVEFSATGPAKEALNALLAECMD